MTAVQIDVWIWTLQQPAELQNYACLLSPDEHARAERFLSAAHRETYIVGRGRLRQILSTYVSQPAVTLSFTYGSAGKPLLNLPDAPHFNLSHSENTAALAVCRTCPVGLDIEAARDITEDIAGRFFSSGEIAALRGTPEHDRSAAFFRCWTRKEAVVKALGDGLNRPLTSFDVSIADVTHPQLHRMADSADETAHWRLFSFSPGPGMAGALACRVSSADDSVAIKFCE